ncbi:MAG: flagellar hook-associated protein 3 FlgL [Thermosediminibacterales bacterium]|nr:flagellar hook-associated protein 3 FlgL [Thermosediminibacterales bacterium]
MRVTNKLLINNFMRNLNYNLKKMKNAQYKLSSGHEIEVASDDPVGASMIMKLKSDLADIRQHMKNVDDAKSWLDYTETALINVGEAIQRLREIVVYGANGSLSDDDRYALAEEVKQLKSHILQEANASYAGRYIFGGYKTDKPPFDDSAAYIGDDGAIVYEVSPSNNIKVNLTGNEVFNSPHNLFAVIDDIYNDLINGSTQELSGKRLSELDDCIDNILRLRAQIGAKVKRLENTMRAYEEDEINFTKLLSQSEDADLAEVVMELSNQENVYRAALATGARIIQPSLVDFLR